MMSKLLTSLALLAVAAVIGGFAVLAVWDVPVEQKTVETEVEASKLLEKAP